MLTFDPEAHKYFWDGQPVPSVTTLLSPLYDFSFVDAGVLKRSADLGTACHLACELYDSDDLDESSLDPTVTPFLDGWIKFRKEREFTPILTEQQVFHPQLRYAGTLDRTGVIEGKEGVIDIKTGATTSPIHGIQLAAYAEALKAQPDWKGSKNLTRWIVQIKNDGTYKATQYTETTDWACFVGLLNVAAWKRKHNIKDKK